jgi:hypothetical protein
VQISRSREGSLENCKAYLCPYFPETIPSLIFEKSVKRGDRDVVERG